MRLSNRQVKAAFWEDSKLLRLHRDARTLFHGLMHLADDSGCVEHDAWGFKCYLFRSPVDADVTPERLEELTAQLVEAGLLIPYKAGGKQCLFVTHFHKHQALRSPAPPDVPLPPWVTWQASAEKQRSGSYAVGDPFAPVTVTPPKQEAPVQPPNDASTTNNGDGRRAYGDLTDSNGDHGEAKGNQARARNELEPERELEFIDHDEETRAREPEAKHPAMEVEEYLRGRMERLLLSSADQQKIREWVEEAGGDAAVITAGIDAGLKAFQKDKPTKVPRTVGFYAEWVLKAIDHDKGRRFAGAPLKQVKPVPVATGPVDEAAAELLAIEAQREASGRAV